MEGLPPGARCKPTANRDRNPTKKEVNYDALEIVHIPKKHKEYKLYGVTSQITDGTLKLEKTLIYTCKAGKLTSNTVINSLILQARKLMGDKPIPIFLDKIVRKRTNLPHEV